MASLTVRPLTSAEDYESYSRLADAEFSRPRSDESLRRWQIYVTQNPDFRSEQVRGVFLAGQFAGGCIVHERLLQMGAARISTGCVSGVVTAPNYRKQGVASALMNDTIEFARSNKHDLLLLDGIAKFYHRYGYVDMFDATDIEVDRAAILAQTAPSSYSIRLATVEDAPSLLELYKRHYAASTGSFERSQALQAHYLRYERYPTLLAQSSQGRIEGYLMHGKDQYKDRGREIGADSWNAALALLQHHARLFDSEHNPKALSYRLPADAPLTQWMIDSLEVPAAPHDQPPTDEWSVREVTAHHRFAGWMARPLDCLSLLRAILPELRVRWQRSLARWSGDIILDIAGMSCMLRLDGSVVQLLEAIVGAPYRVELTPQELTQLVFGYRPLARLADVSHLPAGARSALSILFPTGHTWIPTSDWF